MPPTIAFRARRSLGTILAALTTGLAACSTASPIGEASAAVETPAPTTPTTVGAPVATVTPPTNPMPSTTVAPSTTATTVAPLTTVTAVAIEEIHATLAPVIQAWAAAPSGPAYDAVSSTARSILESGRPLADLPGSAAGRTAELVAGLITYPGSDAEVVALLTQLGPAAPIVTLPPVVTLPPMTAPRFVDTGTDPQFGTCRDAIANGYGPYSRGDAEYGWYDDRDDDGVVCE